MAKSSRIILLVLFIAFAVWDFLRLYYKSHAASDILIPLLLQLWALGLVLFILYWYILKYKTRTFVALKILPLIMLAAIITFFTWAFFRDVIITAISQPNRIPEISKCIFSGGKWYNDNPNVPVHVGVNCFYQYSDGGKKCASSEECQGACYGPGNEHNEEGFILGTCESYTGEAGDKGCIGDTLDEPVKSLPFPRFCGFP